MEIKDPLVEAISLLVKDSYRLYDLSKFDCLQGVIQSSELDDDDFENLQNFCAENSRFFWVTGIGIIEAADLLVRSAIENGNIDCQTDSGVAGLV